MTKKYCSACAGFVDATFPKQLTDLYDKVSRIKELMDDIGTSLDSDAILEIKDNVLKSIFLKGIKDGNITFDFNPRNGYDTELEAHSIESGEIHLFHKKEDDKDSIKPYITIRFNHNH